MVVHIGSAHSRAEILSLKKVAAQWIEKTSGQRRLLLDEDQSSRHLLPLDKCRYLGVRYVLLYEMLSRLLTLFKFHLVHNPLLFDLILIRIVEPASKLHSLELLEEYFGIKHSRRDLYRQLGAVANLKDQVEARILMMAKRHFHFDFSLVFYDVTTLYFESFAPDELRQCGFSKDNKANQPQVLIGLMVNADGFPVAYEMFAGNKFEGHTLIPVIAAFQRKHNIDRLTVVADAAMVSFKNMDELNKNSLGYIVGARLGNLPGNLFQRITGSLRQTASATIRLPTPYGDLICSFSSDRFRKDKHEMEKQVRRATTAIKEPTKCKRMKFLKNTGATRYELNLALIRKQEQLLGVKGYYTNLPPAMDDQSIIRHYHNLWRVEQAFRIAKCDLEMRPIYHFKEQTIRAHILICFMALAVSKYMELKTSKSLKHIIHSLKTVTDARILNLLTDQEITLRTEIPAETQYLLRQLGVWY